MGTICWALNNDAYADVFLTRNSFFHSKSFQSTKLNQIRMAAEHINQFVVGVLKNLIPG